MQKLTPTHVWHVWKSRDTRTIGIILVAFGAVVLALAGDDVPDRSRLTEVSGQLRSLEKVASKGGGLSAVRFALTTDQRHFHYVSSAGHIAVVDTATNTVATTYGVSGPKPFATNTSTPRAGAPRTRSRTLSGLRCADA